MLWEGEIMIDIDKINERKQLRQKLETDHLMVDDILWESGGWITLASYLLINIFVIPLTLHKNITSY